MSRKAQTPTSKLNRDELFHGLKAAEKGKLRNLTENEQDQLIAMLALKDCPGALCVEGLIPQGSFPERLCKFFLKSDASYALPLFQLIMIASSYLTQGGAALWINGLGRQRPILWTIALASSGSSKTLATDKVAEILLPKGNDTPLRMFPTGSTDAQWIIDLKENNGAYWYQDEAGQLFQNILKHSNYTRIKPWMLDAYSHNPIANRLKGEETKLEIEDPHFTFFGLSVRETWARNVDAASMLDGFCQRFNYVIAEPRTDTDMFDHFLSFCGDGIDAWKAELGEVWEALCAQENALGTYQMEEEVMPFLKGWWRGLRTNWGDGALPASFIRRTGFSILSYLVVLHFLLGKSRHPIDLETAELATKYAEYHLESTLLMMREYGSDQRDQICKVANLREVMMADGAAKVTIRDIQRRLSKKQSKELSRDRIAQILEALDRLQFEPDLFEGAGREGADLSETCSAKSARLMERFLPIRDRANQREKWRNEKRMQVLLERHRKQSDSKVHLVLNPHCSKGSDSNVVDISMDRGGAGRKAS